MSQKQIYFFTNVWPAFTVHTTILSAPQHFVTKEGVELPLHLDNPEDDVNLTPAACWPTALWVLPAELSALVVSDYWVLAEPVIHGWAWEP